MDFLVVLDFAVVFAAVLRAVVFLAVVVDLRVVVFLAAVLVDFEAAVFELAVALRAKRPRSSAFHRGAFWLLRG